MTEIPGVQQIPLEFVNAFVLDTRDGRVLVDTGVPFTTDALLAALESTGGMPDLIVLTHAHGDHSGGLDVLGGIPVAAHGTDADLLAEGRNGRLMTPAPHCPDELRELVAQGPPPPIEPIAVDIRLADGDTVPGFDELTVLHTPGHSAGHIAILFDHGGGVLVAGDAAANQGALVPAPVAEDHELNEQSLRRLAGLEFESAVFGHGDAIPSGAGRAFAEVWSPTSA